MQVVHIKFMKIILTDYSALKSSSKMIQEQAAAAVIIALISENKQVRENETKKEESVWDLGLKEEKT